MSNKITPDPLADISENALRMCPKAFNHLPYGEVGFEEAKELAEALTQHAQMGFSVLRWKDLPEALIQELTRKGIMVTPIYTFSERGCPVMGFMHHRYMGDGKWIDWAVDVVQNHKYAIHRQEFFLSWGIYDHSSLPFDEENRMFATAETRDNAAKKHADEMRGCDLSFITRRQEAAKVKGDVEEKIQTGVEEKIQTGVEQATRFNGGGGCLPLLLLAAMIPTGAITTCIWNLL